MNKEEAENRMREIEDWLNAYRNEWLRYDSDHVRKLRIEYRRLANGIKANHFTTLDEN